MTVYADILLLVNVSMDILSLYIVGRIGHKRMSPCRILCASVIGGLCATLEMLFFEVSGVLGGAVNIIIGMVVSIVMTCIAYGRFQSIKSLIRDSVMLWGGGALIGGIMSVVLSLGEPVALTGGNNYLPTFAIVVITALGIVRLFSARSTKKSAEINITVGEDTYSIAGLCDSGSFAAEPISGLPVIIVKSSALAEVATELHSSDCQLKVRLIPIQGVGGGSLLYGFVPDNVTISGNEVAAVVAVDESRGTFAEYMAIIPAALCKKV